MKKLNVLPGIVLICFLFTNCQTELCDEGYTEVDGFCLPDYVVGAEQTLAAGDTYYHYKYGVITFRDGRWLNIDNEPVQDLNLGD